MRFCEIRNTPSAPTVNSNHKHRLCFFLNRQYGRKLAERRESRQRTRQGGGYRQATQVDGKAGRLVGEGERQIGPWEWKEGLSISVGLL